MELTFESILKDPPHPRHECPRNPREYLHNLKSLLREDFLGPLRKDLIRLRSGFDPDSSVCHGTVQLEHILEINEFSLRYFRNNFDFFF